MFLFWILTICVTYFLGEASGTDSDADKGELYTFVELTEDQAKEFVMCWYLSIFVFSMLINFLRIGIITMIAPGCAKTRKEENDAILAGKKVEGNGCAKFYRGFCQTILIPQESVEISLDALCTIEIE